MILYNFNFMGSMREPDTASGHIELHIADNSFAVVGMRGYGGLNYLGPEQPVPEVTESLYRQIHDALISRQYSQDPAGKKPGLKYWPIQSKRISGNIGFGDEVVNIQTGEKFTVNWTHDIRYLNRDAHYHLTNPDRPAPEMKTLEEFMAKLDSIDPLKGWELITKLPKNVYTCIEKEQANGNTYSAHFDDRNFYIVLNNQVYKKHSNISAPMHEAIDILRGSVWAEYVEGSRIEHNVFDVVSTEEFYHPRLFRPERSYRYNTRLTYL